MVEIIRKIFSTKEEKCLFDNQAITDDHENFGVRMSICFDTNQPVIGVKRIENRRQNYRTPMNRKLMIRVLVSAFLRKQSKEQN